MKLFSVLLCCLLALLKQGSNKKIKDKDVESLLKELNPETSKLVESIVNGKQSTVQQMMKAVEDELLTSWTTCVPKYGALPVKMINAVQSYTPVANHTERIVDGKIDMSGGMRVSLGYLGATPDMVAFIKESIDTCNAQVGKVEGECESAKYYDCYFDLIKEAKIKPIEPHFLKAIAKLFK